jgi:hypothetical protein
VRVPRRLEAIVFVTASAQDVSVGYATVLPGRVHDNEQQPRCASFGEGQLGNKLIEGIVPNGVRVGSVGVHDSVAF